MFLHSLLASALAFQARRLAHARWLDNADITAFRSAYGMALVPEAASTS